MYRQKSNRNRILWQISLTIILWVFWLGVFAVQAWFLWDFLSEVSSKLSDDNYIHTIWWKTIITDLYYKSLEIARTNEVSDINNAIKGSIDYMKSNNAQCNLNKTDMLNILYNSNSSFRRSFRQNITNTYKNKPQYPTNEDYLKSCHVFMWCFYKVSNYNETSAILKNCSMKANDIYSQMYINYDNIAAFDQINFADDLFWNGKIDDADYDLLYDIDIIWKILFEWSKSPPQVLYYQFPDVSSLWWNPDPDIPYNGNIDRFSPYDPWDFPSINSWNNNSASGSTSWLNSNPNGIGGLIIWQEAWSLDQEVQNFLESNSSNTYLPNQQDNSNVLNWNICITWSNPNWFQITGVVNSWEVIKKYLSWLIQKIKESQTQSTTSITTWWWSFVSWNIVNLSGDEAITQINDQVEMLSNIDDAASQQAIQWCIDKCDWLPIDDKAICIIKCTCTEFSSPAYGDILKAWAFKIKFCMVPVKNNGFSKNGKTVYSIEEIYNEVSSILISLRDSGELLVSKKTKEFLESSTTKNKFGKIFSFSISSTFKSLFGNSDSKTAKRDEENSTSLYNEYILNFWKGLDVSTERNKYTLISDPLYDVSKNEVIKSSSFVQNKWLTDFIDPSKLIQEDRLIKFNSVVFEFLKTNVAFWQDVLSMMKEIDQTAQALGKKT